MGERVGFLVDTVASLARKLEAYLAGEQGSADVYRGQVKQNRDELKLLANDDEMRETIVASGWDNASSASCWRCGRRA